MEMTKKNYLETLKSALGRSIYHYFRLLKIALLGYVLITSVTLGMSISHIFGTSHSEVL